MKTKAQELNKLVSDGVEAINLIGLSEQYPPEVIYHLETAKEIFQRLGVMARAILRDYDQALDEVENTSQQYKDLMRNHIEQNEVVVTETSKAAAAYAAVGRLMALTFLDGFTNQHPVLEETRALLTAGATDYLNNADGLIECGCNPIAANFAQEVAAWWTAPDGEGGWMGIETDSPYPEDHDC